MDRSAITFLEESKARRLCASWVSLGSLSLAEDHELSLWAAAAGVEKSAARRLRPVLLANRLIGYEGDGARFVADEARRLIEAFAMAKLGGAGG